MSDFVQATLDAIALLKSKIEPFGESVGRGMLIDACYWLELDLRYYLTGRS